MSIPTIAPPHSNNEAENQKKLLPFERCTKILTIVFFLTFLSIGITSALSLASLGPIWIPLIILGLTILPLIFMGLVDRKRKKKAKELGLNLEEEPEKKSSENKKISSSENNNLTTASENTLHIEAEGEAERLEIESIDFDFATDGSVSEDSLSLNSLD